MAVAGHAAVRLCELNAVAHQIVGIAGVFVFSVGRADFAVKGIVGVPGCIALGIGHAEEVVHLVVSKTGAAFLKIHRLNFAVGGIIGKGSLMYTVRNGENLGERVDHLTDSLQTLLRRRRNALTSGRRSDQNPTCLRHILGGMGGVEIKKGANSGLWHPHFHEIALLDAREYSFTEKVVPVRKKHPDDPQLYRRIYVPEGFKAELKAEWKNLTLDSDQIDVRALYPREKYSEHSVLIPCSDEDAALPMISEKAMADEDDGIFSGCCEAAKYALKPGDLTDEERFYAAELLSRRRLIRSYGCFHGLKMSDEKSDDVEDYLRNLNYFEKVYRYYENTDADGNSYSAYLLDRIHQGDEIMHHPFKDKMSSAPRIRRPKEIPKKLSDFERWIKEYFKSRDEEQPF